MCFSSSMIDGVGEWRRGRGGTCSPACSHSAVSSPPGPPLRSGERLPGSAWEGALFQELDFQLGVVAGLCSTSNLTLLRGLDPPGVPAEKAALTYRTDSTGAHLIDYVD
jgi:hypothetical protein